MRIVNMDDGTLSDFRRVSDTSSGEQKNIKIANLKADNVQKAIVVWEGEGLGIASPNSGIFFYPIEETDNLKIGLA